MKRALLAKCLLRAVVAGLLVLASAAPAWAEDDAETRAIYLEAVELLRGGNGERALRLLQQVRNRLGTTNPRLQADLVRAAAAAGEDALVLAELRRWREAGGGAEVEAELERLGEAAQGRLGAEKSKQEAEERAAEAARAEAHDEVDRRIGHALAQATQALHLGDEDDVVRALAAIDEVSDGNELDLRVAKMQELRPRLEERRSRLASARADAQAERHEGYAAARQSEARSLYILGTVFLLGGLASTGGGIAILATDPFDSPASYPVGGAALGLGVGALVFWVPDYYGRASDLDARDELHSPRIAVSVAPDGAGLRFSGAF